MMKRKLAAVISVMMIMALTGCASGTEETTKPGEDVQTTPETVIPEESITVYTYETMQPVEPEEYSVDVDAGKWFSEILEGWTRGGDGSISDESRVGVALYDLSDGETVNDMIFDASVEDCSSLRAQGAVEGHVEGCNIYKMNGDSKSADDSGFYGKNAAVQCLDGAYMEILNTAVTAGAENAAGVFAYNGGVVCIADSTVNVTGGGAGGIQVAGGGELYAYNLMVTSEHSSAFIIEGNSSATLNNCAASGTDESTKEGSVKANVLLYQSMSGDAGEGTSEFTMNGGSMTAGSGTMFCCTNTRSIVNLNNVSFHCSNDSGFMTVSKGRWGNDGENGGECTLNAKDQVMEGDILVDEISSIMINMTGSTFKGAVNPEGEAGRVDVVMDDGSEWILTSDSHITSFEGNTDNITASGYHLYVNGEMIK